MTKRWQLKTNSFNILLVLITLILVEAEWIAAAAAAESPEETDHQTQIYVGNDEIAQYFFGSSVSNDSLVLEGFRRCLDSFQLFTCMKMLLLSRINEVESLMEDPSVAQKDLQVFGGLLTFRVKKTTANPVPKDTDGLSLDEEIAARVQRIFWRRSLFVNFLPKMKIEIEPSRNSKDNFLCFRYAVHPDEKQSGEGVAIEGRKRKKGGMPMMMIVPPLIMLGLMPFTLASLKAMVMNAVMINMMALNGAIFMTIRNLVFGPRRGDNVKYVNYGYSKDRQTQSRRPVLIIHSPAAFVKQPPVHRHRRPSVWSQNHISDGGSSHSYGHQNGDGDDENQYYFTYEKDYNHGHNHKTGNGSPENHRRTNIRSEDINPKIKNFTTNSNQRFYSS